MNIFIFLKKWISIQKITGLTSDPPSLVGLATVLKGLKNNEAPGADSVVNEFLKYGVSEVRSKLLKIVKLIFEKWGST